MLLARLQSEVHCHFNVPTFPQCNPAPKDCFEESGGRGGLPIKESEEGEDVPDGTVEPVQQGTLLRSQEGEGLGT